MNNHILYNVHLHSFSLDLQFFFITTTQSTSGSERRPMNNTAITAAPMMVWRSVMIFLLGGTVGVSTVGLTDNEVVKGEGSGTVVAEAAGTVQKK